MQAISFIAVLIFCSMAGFGVGVMLHQECAPLTVETTNEALATMPEMAEERVKLETETCFYTRPEGRATYTLVIPKGATCVTILN